MHILEKKRENCIFFMIPIMHLVDCAQIVPAKVKYFQIVPNETKSWLKKLNRINWLKFYHYLIFRILVYESAFGGFKPVLSLSTDPAWRTMNFRGLQISVCKPFFMGWYWFQSHLTRMVNNGTNKIGLDWPSPLVDFKNKKRHNWPHRLRIWQYFVPLY